MSSLFCWDSFVTLQQSIVFDIMVIEILLVISILLQLAAAIVAIGLIRGTKYNSSWILFTIALSSMAFMRFGEYINLKGGVPLPLPGEFFVWMGIVTSLCFAIGVILIQRILKYIYGAESQRRVSEQRILNTVLRTEEKERLRFSKDIHDGLGPLLSSAKMSVSALSTTDMDDRNREIVNNTTHVLNEAIRSLREISVNLSPHILIDFGLSRAISNFINRLPSEGVKINFETNLNSERFDTDVEVILYRVVCELINNSLKHSAADLIDIHLTVSDGLIHIDYSDNGRGFVYDDVTGSGMGLTNIASRIRSLKGEINIDGRPGVGMLAVIDITL